MRPDHTAQHLVEVEGMSPASNNVNNDGVGGGEQQDSIVKAGDKQDSTTPANPSLRPRKSAKAKSPISREKASLLPLALEGVHWRREDAPAHSKSGSAVTRCLMLTDPSCITFSRRNYLEDHFRVVHQLYPSKPRVGRKKISNKPSRCISPSARERMADHMQGEFPFKFWKAKKKRFVMSTTKAKHMWSSVPGHEHKSDDARREWVWGKASQFYKSWREGPLALETMQNLANHVEGYWCGKGILDKQEIATKGRIPPKFEEFVSDEEPPTWETNKDGREVCRRKLKIKAIEGESVDDLLLEDAGDGADSASDEKDEPASIADDPPSVTNMEVVPSVDERGLASVPKIDTVPSVDAQAVTPEANMDTIPSVIDQGFASVANRDVPSGEIDQRLAPGEQGQSASNNSNLGTDTEGHRHEPQNSEMDSINQGQTSASDGMQGALTTLLNGSDGDLEGLPVVPVSSDAVTPKIET